MFRLRQILCVSLYSRVFYIIQEIGREDFEVADSMSSGTQINSQNLWHIGPMQALRTENYAQTVSWLDSVKKPFNLALLLFTLCLKIFHHMTFTITMWNENKIK